MATVGEDLDICQRVLRDTSGIWSREELRRHYQQGYRQLLAQSQGVCQFRALPMPPQTTFSLCYDWERRHTRGGTWRQFTLPSAFTERVCTSLWEVEQTGHVTPSTQYTAITQLWELGYTSGEVDTQYRFVLPRNHDRIRAMWWDNWRMEPLTVRELDDWEFAWYRQQGRPEWWSIGLGETRSVEVYAIQVDNNGPYASLWGPLWDYQGMPRYFSGERDYTCLGGTWDGGAAYTTDADQAQLLTAPIPFLVSGGVLRLTSEATSAGYQCTQTWEVERHEGETTFTDGQTVGCYGWEADFGAENMANCGLGVLREATSPDRQYLVTEGWNSPLGIIRELCSSDQGLLIWEVIVPDVPALEEDDTPTMIPAPLQKYLRYYTLYCAFNRQGEGYRPDLAGHFLQRWTRGPKLLQKLCGLTWADVQYAREPTADGQRGIPVPTLPAGYPRVRVRGG